MKITVDWLKEKKACSEGIEYFETLKEENAFKVFNLMIRKKENLIWANWAIVRLMEKPQFVAYAIYAAEQVIDIFEKKYPDDKRPRKAIEAAKAYLKNPNKDTAYAAGYDADAAADAATYAAYAAAYAAYAASDAASDAAANAAANAAARIKMQIKILKYGLKLLEEKK